MGVSTAIEMRKVELSMRSQVSHIRAAVHWSNGAVATGDAIVWPTSGFSLDPLRRSAIASKWIIRRFAKWTAFGPR